MQRKEAQELELKKKYSVPAELEELQKVEAFIKDYRHFIDTAKPNVWL